MSEDTNRLPAIDLDHVAAPALPDIPSSPAMPADFMAGLEQMISTPPRVPKIGLDAAKAMTDCFEAVADDVLRLAKDGVDRANEVLQEAVTYATVLRETGEVLAARIRAESSRTLHIALVLREARERLRETPPDPPTQN